MRPVLFVFCLLLSAGFSSVPLTAQTAPSNPDDNVLIFVEKTKIPSPTGFVDLCIEEPYFGLGTPYYVLSLDKCSGAYDYFYLEDEDFLEAQADGVISPDLPLHPTLPDDARSRVTIAWLDLKHMFKTDERPTDAVGEDTLLHSFVGSIFADLGLPPPGPGTMFAVVFGLAVLTMRNTAMRIVSSLMWVVLRFKSKEARVGKLRSGDAAIPQARLSQAALDVMAHVAMINGAFNQSALPVITDRYRDITGQAPSSSVLAKLFATDAPPLKMAKIGRGLNTQQRVTLLNAGYTVAKADGPLTGPELGFLKELSQTLKVRLPVPTAAAA